MAPELFHTMEANELLELGQKIRDWQLIKKLSDNELCKKFGELGSTKTFKKILDNQLEEVDLERQLNNYRTAWALMEGNDLDELDDGEIEIDIWAVVKLHGVFQETRKEKGLARAIFLIGPSGSGKTCAQDFLRAKHGPRIISIRAVVAWNDSPMAMMAAILDRLGVKNPPTNQAERFVKTVEKLNETRRAVFIEDSHHLGPRCLALVISLIDETPGEFLISAVDSLWMKLQSRAYQEIEQLRINRIAEKITLGREVKQKDVEKLIVRRLTWDNEKTPSKILPELIAKANSYGRLAFVREVIKRAAIKANGEAMSEDMFKASMSEEVLSR